jgi:hypothetical protein
MEFDDQKARQRATSFANRKAAALYKSAERKLMPRKGELSWNFVFQKAFSRLTQGQRLEGLEKEILEYVKTPYPISEKVLPRQGFVGKTFGKVQPKGGKW